MYISEIKSELIDNYKLRIPSMVWGPPGAGKSDMMRQVCTALGITCKDERVPTLDPVDLRGVPSVENGFTLFNVPNLLPKVDRDGEYGIFFLDELPTAQPAMQAACYQLTLDRKIGDYELPPGWVVMAAGNEVGHKAGAHRMLTALANRFGHYHLEVDVDEWLNWGLSAGIDEDLLAFIKYKPDLLQDKEMVGHAFATPRSWNNANKHKPLMTPANEFNKIQAFVGPAAATQYNLFMKIVRELPTIDEILANPTTARCPDRLDIVLATCSLLLKHVEFANFPTLMKYVDRIPEEFQAHFTTEAIKRNEDIADTKEYTDWAVKMSTKIF